MPQRRDYIDELKGLGILLVVLGHFIEQYRMGYSFVSASFFCIYAFHMALFCICSGLVARFNPRKLVTQQLWLYLVGQTLMLAFRAAVLRENFAETGGLLAAWLLPWRHIWYLYALIFWHLTLPVLCRLRDRLGLAGSCLGMALAVALAAWISGLLTRPLRQLSAAAARLARGEYDAPLPTAQNDEIGALIRAFSGMSGAIGEREAALRAQAEERQALIDALAHEMRTPLTAILGGARLLGQSKLSEGQQSELLDMMAREAARLSTMDERLLLLTRLDHEAPAFAPFDSQAMAREALSVFDGVRLEGEGAAFVGERELTILLLRNLVVNAQRAGGETPVCVTLHPDGFDVTDCGCGMTEEQLAHAFEPFYKADKARTRGAGGAGLGLSLCRKIARLHRGDVRIESKIGKGTRVCYRFDTSL